MTDFINHPMTQLLLNPAANGGWNLTAYVFIGLFVGMIIGAVLEWRAGK